ncbi:MAG: CoA transferase [Desulfovibrio sp.]|jgi:L-carnitine CoA-transferase|nr:CoA transferase [Desulfovibrio sp.]
MVATPKFGPLTGVRVILSGSAYAGPFAATLMSDYGADVTSIESSRAGDMIRAGSFFQHAHRNQKCIALDMVSPEGKEVIKRLVTQSDILIENSKAGQWAKWGMSDDALWGWNPKLVIAHISGFGQNGEKKYTSRGSYDGIGQAFGGLMFMNGEPAPSPPLGVNPFMSDYLVATYASWCCLAAYINTQKTGKGESIDLAQYEACVYTMSDALMNYLNHGITYKRTGEKNPKYGGWQPFQCKDGVILVVPAGPSAYNKGLPWLGIEIGNETFPADWQFVPRGSKADEIMSAALAKFCAERTVEEAEKELNDNFIFASPIMTHEMMDKHPHYKARQTLTEWENTEGRKIRGPSPVFKFKNNPGKVWRGAPRYGQDNEEVLRELGFDEAEIKAMYEKKVLNKK